MKYPTLESQVERFKQLGFLRADAMDMNDVWKLLLDFEDTKRFVPSLNEWVTSLGLCGYTDVFVVANDGTECLPSNCSMNWRSGI
jgi:hypothetical protein